MPGCGQPPHRVGLAAMIPLRSRRSRAVTALAGVAAATALAGPAAAGAATPVPTGLAAPRGVDAAAAGRVLIAEQGPGTCPGGAPQCITTSRILRLERNGSLTKLADAPSVSAGGFALGAVDVAVSGLGRPYVLFPAGPPELPGLPADLSTAFGDVFRLRPGGRLAQVADVAAHQATDPDPTNLEGDPAESNPYGLEAGFGVAYVADAAGNDLLRVFPNGRVQTVARFPNQVVSTAHIPAGEGPPLPPELPTEAVPTSVAIGPDGALYVGELKGFPHTPGTSRVWRIERSARDADCDPAATTGPCRIFADGFSAIHDLDFGRDGTLYVLELHRGGAAAFEGGGDPTGTGRLVRVRPDGTRTELLAGELTAPGGVAVTRRGEVYVTNRGVPFFGPGAGELLRTDG